MESEILSFIHNTEKIGETYKFMLECRRGKPYVHYSVTDIGDKKRIYKTHKIKFFSKGKKKIVRTLIINDYIFSQLLNSFGIERQESLNIREQIRKSAYYGNSEIFRFESEIKKMLSEYKLSDRYQEDSINQKSMLKRRLLDRIEKEITEKFYTLISLGKGEDYIQSLFRRAEVESLLKA